MVIGFLSFMSLKNKTLKVSSFLSHLCHPAPRQFILGTYILNTSSKPIMFIIKKNCPSNAEKGNFLALDLGGTNFRVLLVKLNGHDVDIQSKTYLIPQRVMLGTGTQVCHDAW